MKNMNRQNQPTLIPLILIVIGTTLLAIPSSYGTLLLLIDQLSFQHGIGSVAKSPEYLACSAASVFGFLLLFGYYWTLFTKRHFVLFWAASAVFNLMIALIVLIFAFEPLLSIELQPLFLFPVWVLFVAASSIYYALTARRQFKLS